MVKRIEEPYESLKESFPGLTEETMNELRMKIKEENPKRMMGIPESQLDRLIINISNDCNMRCKYCYANQGTYGKSENLISLEYLKKTLDTFFEIFDAIGLIQLFGGEPTLNMEAIEFVGEYLKNKVCTTQFGLVTNATIITDQFINMVNEYDIKVTVSVDVEKIHDDLRPFPKDAPSWNWVKDNIHKLQNKTSQPSQIEFTFTKVHEEHGLMISDILKELKKEYGNIPIHVAPVCSEDMKFHLPTRNSFIESVDDIYNLKKSGIDLTYSTLKTFELSLKHKIPFDYFCGAGISTLAVSTIGDIYPCFYFIDNADFKIANVYDVVKEIKQAIMDKRDALYGKPKSKTEKCNKCFAKAVCTGCLGANYTKTGDPFTAEDDHCKMTKSMIEEILRRAVEG